MAFCTVNATPSSPAALSAAGRLRALAGPQTPNTLVVNEIFASIQGESSYAGLPCVFVRTTGCHLRCRYCDTTHAFFSGTRQTLTAIMAQVATWGIRLVEITGGEPLLQPNVLPLMSQLCDAGYTVLLETNGAQDIRAVDHRVVRIMDFKAPSSGEEAANRYGNVAALRPQDEVKLVLGDRNDYLWARHLIAQHALAQKCQVIMGVVFGVLDPQQLVAWVLADQLPVRVQLQLHKIIWHPSTQGV